MKIVGANGREIDCSNAIGSVFIALGLAEEVEVPAYVPPFFAPDTVWSVALVSGTGEPRIHAYCKNCARHVDMFGRTPYKSQKFFHCGTGESVPQHIADEFVQARKKYVAPPEPNLNPDRTPGKTVFVNI